jgi:hypothetical protein
MAPRKKFDLYHTKVQEVPYTSRAQGDFVPGKLFFVAIILRGKYPISIDFYIPQFPALISPSQTG